MPTVHDVTAALESLAPLHFAEDWDNVGLLLGAREDALAGPVLLTIDLTDAVMDEAVRAGAAMIIAYHPPIFGGLKRLTADDPSSRRVLRAARAGMAIFSPHTALDAAPGGLNDWLAEGLGAGAFAPLVAHAEVPRSEAFKIVTFVPEAAVDAVRARMGEAGAGRIGDYTLCSFELRGSGTFLGGASTNPTVGAKGTLERVDEVRLEMVCGAAALAGALDALRAAHPYEEPPIEAHALQPRPSATTGAGRLVRLAAPVDRSQFCERVKTILGVEHLKIGWVPGGPDRVSAVGLCVGAGGSLLDAAIGAGADTFVTGEMRHHDVLSAQARGCAVVLAGHTNTERGYLPVLRDRLTEALDGVEIIVSNADTAPLTIG